jgi:hypothetical protein
MLNLAEEVRLRAGKKEYIPPVTLQRKDFYLWELFFRECCNSFGLLLVLGAMGFLALYAGVVAGYVERIPTLEEILVEAGVNYLFEKKPAVETPFNNIAANCFAGTLTPCQLELIDSNAVSP